MTVLALVGRQTGHPGGHCVAAAVVHWPVVLDQSGGKGLTLYGQGIGPARIDQFFQPTEMHGSDQDCYGGRVAAAGKGMMQIDALVLGTVRIGRIEQDAATARRNERIERELVEPV